MPVSGAERGGSVDIAEPGAIGGMRFVVGTGAVNFPRRRRQRHADVRSAAHRRRSQGIAGRAANRILTPRRMRRRTASRATVGRERRSMSRTVARTPRRTQARPVRTGRVFACGRVPARRAMLAVRRPPAITAKAHARRTAATGAAVHGDTASAISASAWVFSPPTPRSRSALPSLPQNRRRGTRSTDRA